MNRILDIDLDFFVQPVAHWQASSGPRLPEGDYQAWNPDAAMEFLRERCKLSANLPGWVVEHHDEVFWHWRNAIDAGRVHPPFHVTHIDAHADVGLGDAGYVHLVTNLMHQPVGERSDPERIGDALGCGNWLAFATACRWVSDLDYVYGPGGGDDLLNVLLNEDRTALQLRAASRQQLDRALASFGQEVLEGVADPPVPLRQFQAEDFAANEPYSAISLCRSPGFTPASADRIFDLIQSQFITAA